MAGLLVAISVMGVIMSIVLPVWSQAAKREREAELVFRGEQYVRAIELYQRQYVGAYPPDLETLVDQRFLRRLYKDPMSDDGEFRLIYQSEAEDFQAGPALDEEPGESDGESNNLEDRRPSFSGPIQTWSRSSGGVIGVVSTSSEPSLRIHNGSENYDEWPFIYRPTSTSPGTDGTPTAIRGRRLGTPGSPRNR